MEPLVFRLEPIDLFSLFTNGCKQTVDFLGHLLSGTPVLMLLDM